MKIRVLDVEAGHFCVRDDDAFGIAAGVQFAANLHSGFGCRRDKIDDHAIADQGFGAAVPLDLTLGPNRAPSWEPLNAVLYYDYDPMMLLTQNRKQDRTAGNLGSPAIRAA